MVCSFFPENRQCILELIGALISTIIIFKVVGVFIRLTHLFVYPKFAGNKIDFKKLGDWAIVTGSTDGIGKAYAKEFARLGLNIVLISRTQSKLDDVAKEIEEKFKVKTKTVAIDFSADASIYDKIYEAVKALDIAVLINNVGMGLEHPNDFLNVDEKTTLNLVSVNITSVVMMTHRIVPLMVKRNKGVVVNISSGSALFPMPMIIEYAAGKSFVDSFTVGLSVEYSNTNLIIQSVLPFFVATKLSKQKPSLFCPSPDVYVRAAVATIGRSHRTLGCLVHEVQALVIMFLYRIFGDRMLVWTKSTMLKVKASALRREQRKAAAAKAD